MRQIRDYGDGQHLILHIAPGHPALVELRAAAAWVNPYFENGRASGYDLAFEYDGPEARAELRARLLKLSNETEISENGGNYESKN